MRGFTGVREMSDEWLSWMEGAMGTGMGRDLFEGLLVFAGVWIGLHLLYRFVLRNLPVWFARLSPGHTRLAHSIVDAVHPVFFPLLALFIALGRFDLGGWQRRVLEALIAALVLIQMLLIANRLIEYTMNRIQGRTDGNGQVEHAKSNLVTLTKAVVWGAALLFFFDNFGVNVTTFVAGLGIGGIAVALAAQAILGDTFSSFTISVDKPFDVGDFIKVGDLTGTVIDIGLRTTHVRSLSGELWVVPNSDLTKSRLQNFSDLKERRVVFKLQVAYGSSAEVIMALTQEVQRIISAQEKTRFDRAHFSSFSEWSLDIEVVWYMLSSSYNEYMDTQQRIYLEILRYCQEREVDLAFPTRTIVLEKRFSEAVLNHAASVPTLPGS